MRTELTDDSLHICDVKELSATTARSFRETALAALPITHRNIDVDLSQTDFVDSCGLGALVALQQECKVRKGKIRLRNPTRPVQQMLELTRIPQIMEVVSDS